MKKRFLAMVLAVLVTANTISVPEVKAVENGNSESVENEEVSEDVTEKIQNEETEEVEDDLSAEETVTQETAEKEQAAFSLEFADEEVATYTVTIENEEDLVYNGKAQTPVVKVTDTKGNVVDSKNYDVAYTVSASEEPVESIIEAGEYKCTITSNDNATEKFTESVCFNVRQFHFVRDIDIDKDHWNYEYAYSGEEVGIKEDIQKYLMEHNPVLSNPEDYNIRFEDWDAGNEEDFIPVNPGTYHLYCEISSTGNNPNIIGKTHFDYIYVTVKKLDLSNLPSNVKLCVVSSTNNNVIEYTGKSINPVDYCNVAIDQSGALSILSKNDYTLTCSKEVINAGTYNVAFTIKAKKGGNISGSTSFMSTVVVSPKKISTDNIKVSTEEIMYTGKEGAVPNVYVTYTDENGEKVVLSKKDYDISSENGTDLGVHYLYVTSKDGGNYTWDGSVEATYSIVPFDIEKHISDMTVEADYIGKEIEIDSLVKSKIASVYGLVDSNYELEIKNLNNENTSIINVGTYDLTCKMTPEGNEYLKGEKTFHITVNVNKFDLNKASEDKLLYVVRKQNVPDITYTGEKIEAKNYYEAGYYLSGEPVLFDENDYDLTFNEDIVNAGSYETAFTIKSNENGNLKLSGSTENKEEIVVLPKEISPDDLNIVLEKENLVYKGKELKAPSIKSVFIVETSDEGIRTIELKESDYNVSAETGIKVGKYKIYISAKKDGNYIWDGTAESSYNIVQFNLNNDIVINDMVFEDDYTGGIIDLAQAVRNDFSYIPGDYHLIFQTEDGQEVDETDLQIVDAGDYIYTCIVTPGDDPYITEQKKFPVKLTVHPLDISKISKTDVYVENISDIIYTGEKIDPSECYEAGYVQDGEQIAFDKDDYTLTFSNKKMINAGTYQGTFTVKANSDGNLKGSFTCKGAVTVAPKEIPADQVAVVLTKEYQFYNGKMQNAPGVKAVYYEIPTEDLWDDFDLVKLSTKDYEVVKGSKASEVGEYKVYVTAKKGGNYTWEGNAVGTYDICKNAAKFVVDVSKVKYLGDEPQIVVYEDKAAASAKADPLVEDEDYYVESDFSKTSKVTFIIKGIGKYTGTKKVTVAVEKYSLEDARENGNININIYGDTSYTGSAVKPELRISVKSEGQTSQWITLFDKQDYTVTYSNNVKVGSGATVTIKGKGNFTGTIKETFEVKKIDLENVYVDIKPVKESNKVWKPSAILYNKNTGEAVKLKADKDYTIELSKDANTKEAGKYDVFVTAMDGAPCVGKTTGELHVYKQSASSFVVVVNSGNKVVYDGTDKREDPDFVTVYANKADAKAGKNALTPAEWDDEANKVVGDYTIDFEGDTTNAGTVTAIIKGENDYADEKKVKITINKLNLKYEVMWMDPYDHMGEIYGKINGHHELTCYYTGEELKPFFEISEIDFYSDTEEEWPETLTVKYANNVNLTTAKKQASMTVTGKGNFTGSVTLKFSIVEKPNFVPGDNELPIVPAL